MNTGDEGGIKQDPPPRKIFKNLLIKMDEYTQKSVPLPIEIAYNTMNLLPISFGKNIPYSPPGFSTCVHLSPENKLKLERK